MYFTKQSDGVTYSHFLFKRLLESIIVGVKVLSNVPVFLSTRNYKAPETRCCSTQGTVRVRDGL